MLHGDKHLKHGGEMCEHDFLLQSLRVTHYSEVNLLTHDFHLSNDIKSQEQTSTSNQFFFIIIEL